MGGMNGLNLTQDVADAFYMADGSDYSLPTNHWEPIGTDKKFSGYTLKANAAKMYDNREMRFMSLWDSTIAYGPALLTLVMTIH